MTTPPPPPNLHVGEVHVIHTHHLPLPCVHPPMKDKTKIQCLHPRLLLHAHLAVRYLSQNTQIGRKRRPTIFEYLVRDKSCNHSQALVHLLPPDWLITFTFPANQKNLLGRETLPLEIMANVMPPRKDGNTSIAASKDE